MLEVLHNVIDLDLRGLLCRRDEWKSVHVTYHAPRVERLWIQHGTFRVFLHRIYPCEPGESLFHPHPWPSAVRVVSGRYEHLLAADRADPFFEDSVGADPQHGPVLSRAILSAGSEYEMVERTAWHSVRPLGGFSDSIMVTGTPYATSVAMPRPPTEKQGPLSPERFDALFQRWLDRMAFHIDDTPWGSGAPRDAW